MKREYLVPATIAATLHALVFVGPPHAPLPLATVIERTQKDVDPVTKSDELPLLAATDAASRDNDSSGNKEAVPVPEVPPPPTSPGGDRIVVPVNFDGAQPGPRLDHIPLIIGPTGFGDGAVGGPILAVQLDNPPRARTQVEPVYPAGLKHDRVEGAVIVNFVVETDGAVSAAEVVRSTNRLFESETLRALARWRFEPGLKNGRAVRFRMEQKFVFRLDGN